MSTTGCYNPDHPRLAREIASLKTVGTPLPSALATLEAHGFGCQENVEYRAAPADLPGQRIVVQHCTRGQSGGFLMGCIETVIIDWQGDPPMVSNINVREIACTGF